MTRYSSLRWRLTALIVGGSVVTAGIAAAGFSWLDLSRFWQSSQAQVVAIGNIVADQAGPAITLRDRKAGTEILSSLHEDRLIREAFLYDVRGQCFAAYQPPGSSGCPPMPADGARRAAGALLLARPVSEGGERLGTLAIAASVPSIASIVRQYIGGAALILTLSMMVAAMLGVVLQARVSAPILRIAKVAQRIAETHRFEDRVGVASADEVGVLAESFNAMLDEIGRRDAELTQHRRWLEEQVAARNRVNQELRAAKEKAEEAARLKTEFLTNMSHEIRTPMNGVIGMISLVLDRCEDAELRAHLEVAQAAGESLVTILNDILDLSKIEAGKMTLEAIDFDLGGLLSESLRIFEIAAGEKHLELTVAMASGCPGQVRGDPVRLRQVLVNLVGNAVKFTAAGSVRVKAGPTAPGHVLFEVCDTGPGIPESKLSAIFEAFTQADGSHTRRFGGTGLGLTITRRLVQLMGGHLWAESEVGRGSRFNVELPLEAASGPVAPAVPSPALRPPKLPALHVLVAEDNLVNQKVVCAMLRRQHCTVTLAANGREAYERFLQEPFDLVLMDVQMPEMDGLEACRLIRELERRNGRRTPIVALTAHAAEAQKAQCLAQGMDGVITKPVSLHALLWGVSQVMNQAAPAGEERELEADRALLVP